MSKFSSSSSNIVNFVISCSPKSIVKGDKAKAVDTIETGLDAGREEGLEPDRERGIAELFHKIQFEEIC
jgi:hypothetical protein